MTYKRVIPRDLFNEAKLLKCYGQLYLCLEKLFPIKVEFELIGDSFDIYQQPYDGNIFIYNLSFSHNIMLYSPLNSRDDYPLMFCDVEYQVDNEVFDSKGLLTEAFKSFIVRND